MIICRQFQCGFFLSTYDRAQLTINDGSLMHLQRCVMNIALNAGLGLQLEHDQSVYGPFDRAIDDDVICMDLTGHSCSLGDDEDAGQIRLGANVSDNRAVNTQAVRKVVIPVNLTSFGNQAFDGGLLFFIKHVDTFKCDQLYLDRLHGFGDRTVQDFCGHPLDHGLRWQLKNTFDAAILLQLEHLSPAR